MPKHIDARGCLLLVALLGGCASTQESPLAQLETPSGNGICPMRIENATGLSLEVHYQAGQMRTNLDATSPGDSHVVGVPCNVDRVSVIGLAHQREGTSLVRFRQVVTPDPSADETVVRLTVADRIR